MTSKSKIFVNSFPVTTFTFSGGERQIQLPKELDDHKEAPVSLVCLIKDSDGIMDMLLTADALGSNGFQIGKLNIPYLPYARQDRACSPGEAFSLRVMSHFINAIQAFEVRTIDVHSEVAHELIPNLMSIPQDALFQSSNFRENVEMRQYLNDPKNLVIIAPDKGAEAKAARVSLITKGGFETATKVRDPKTGQITETKFTPKENLKGKNLLIVDDICDGGRTFLELAKVIRANHDPACIGLYVSHGLFSKGTTVLKRSFHDIFHINYNNPINLELETVQ